MSLISNRADELVTEAEESRRKVQAEKGCNSKLTDQYLVGWLSSKAAGLESMLKMAQAYARRLEEEASK